MGKSHKRSDCQHNREYDIELQNYRELPDYGEIELRVVLRRILLLGAENRCGCDYPMGQHEHDLHCFRVRLQHRKEVIPI